MLQFTRWVLILLDIGTWLTVAFFTAMMATLLLGLPIGTDRIRHAAAPGEIVSITRWVIVTLAIGVATGVAVDRIFRWLLQMLDTVATGQPFIRANGTRLRAIAWALLAIQLLDLGFARVALALNAATHRIIFTWTPSATGWLAVLLLFVLAQVFARGAEIQDDLEGTI